MIFQGKANLSITVFQEPQIQPSTSLHYKILLLWFSILDTLCKIGALIFITAKLDSTPLILLSINETYK